MSGGRILESLTFYFIQNVSLCKMIFNPYIEIDRSARVWNFNSKGSFSKNISSDQ